jgi:leucyl aminopeptidase (aminopeptidase T)
MMAKEWYEILRDMGSEIGFSVELLTYEATGQHNKPLPSDLLNELHRYHLILAMTQFSATTSLVPICRAKNSITRCVSMPLVEKRMEHTSFLANYQEVKEYAIAIERLLTKSIAAKVLFSTGDQLFIDLRNRVGGSDTGECYKPRQIINFPSGEGYIAPYEATIEESHEFGSSKTKGVLPISYQEDIVKCTVKNNTIIEVTTDNNKSRQLSKFFEEKVSRRNIAELGIGCNPKAVITGNLIEDEKAGLHIAYGTSSHIGGKITSDIHQDIVFAKGCLIEGKTLTLFLEGGKKIELIKNAKLRYDILQ